jgi:plastocyanin
MSGFTVVRFATLAVAVTIFAACGGGAETASTPTNGSAPTGSSNAAVKLTGKVIEVEMYTDENGNYYKPNDIEVHRGDVLRFVLKAGVHNVHFLADSNPGKTGLPAASEYLQIPGQTWDLTVDFAPGHYFFQCDPHAALGMVAKLEVEDE